MTDETKPKYNSKLVLQIFAVVVVLGVVIYFPGNLKLNSRTMSIHNAAASGDLEMIKYFLKKGVSIEKTTRAGDQGTTRHKLRNTDHYYTPLKSAIVGNQLEAVKLLIQFGAQVHIKPDRTINNAHLVLAYENSTTEMASLN
jgi:ankyrin repeat protein